MISSAAAVLSSASSLLATTTVAVDLLSKNKNGSSKAKRQTRAVEDINSVYKLDLDTPYTAGEASLRKVDDNPGSEYGTKDNTFKAVIRRQLGNEGLIYLVSITFIFLLVMFMVICIFFGAFFYYSGNIATDKAAPDIIGFV